MSFQDFGLSEDVLSAVDEMGFQEPTPVQAVAIPSVLEGKDLLASSQTGTGKTAAFAMPIITKLKQHGTLRALVLEPTRELAAQVGAAFVEHARFTDLNISTVFGGVGYGKQREELAAGADVVVATPGRLMDYMQQGEIRLEKLDFLVLDEVDRMLDMGFLPDVRRIVGQCPDQRQTLLFSATLPPEIRHLCDSVLKDPEVIQLGEGRSPAETIDHAVYPVAKDQKFDLLLEFLKRNAFKSTIIFTATKHGADSVAARLKAAGHEPTILHSDKSQVEREEALAGFKSGKFDLMVATDLASRGIDVTGVEHVINYDVSQRAEDYVHRIGRTGRAKRQGNAVTILTAEELPDLLAIERFIGKKIERKRLENFPYVYTALFDEDHALASLRSSRGVRTHRGTRFGVRRRR